jgi:hypothetical protein
VVKPGTHAGFASQNIIKKKKKKEEPEPKDPEFPGSNPGRST